MYVGMDVKAKSLVAYAVNEREPRVCTGKQSATRAGLRALVRQVGTGSKLVAFDAGNQLKWIAETRKSMAAAQGHVVHPNEVTWSTESWGKTDRVDAKKLAELARAASSPIQVVRWRGATSASKRCKGSRNGSRDGSRIQRVLAESEHILGRRRAGG